MPRWIRLPVYIVMGLAVGLVAADPWWKGFVAAGFIGACGGFLYILGRDGRV